MIDTQEIVRLEKEADELDLSADGKRYEAAHLISEALTEGWTQRSLAERIGKSAGHVNKCAKIWAEYGSDSPEKRPAWRDAYRARSGKGDKPEAPKEPRTPAAGVELALPIGPGIAEYADANDWTLDRARQVSASLFTALQELELWITRKERE